MIRNYYLRLKKSRKTKSGQEAGRKKPWAYYSTVDRMLSSFVEENEKQNLFNFQYFNFTEFMIILFLIIKAHNLTLKRMKIQETLTPYLTFALLPRAKKPEMILSRLKQKLK